MIDELLPRPLAELLTAPITDQFPGVRLGTSRFDGPGGTLVHAAVRDAMAHYLGSDRVANDHGAFPASHYSDTIAQWASGRVRELFGTSGGHVVLGPNMTTLTAMFTRAIETSIAPGDEIVCTELDHEANVWPWRAMAERRGARVRIARLEPDGSLPTAAVTGLVTERTRWVAVTAASNALGTLVDLPAVVTAAHAAGARTYVDGVQLVAHEPVALDDWGVDAFVTSAYKWYGPHGAALWMNDAAAAEATLPEQVPSAGTDLPGRLDLGTTAFETILGIGVAAQVLLSTDRTAIRRREQRLATMLREGLQAIPGVRLLGPTHAPRAPIVTFQLAGQSAEKVATALAERNVSVWHGTFYCSAAMRAVCADEPEAIRAGIAWYTTEREVDALIAGVATMSRSQI